MTAVLTPIGAILRPPGHGAALDQAAIDLARKGQLQRQPPPIPPCPERVDDPYVAGTRWRGCVLCGRVTPRVDRDWAPWCGGQAPKRPIPVTTPLRNERTQGVCELCGETARIFPTGWRCTACRPQPTGGAA